LLFLLGESNFPLPNVQNENEEFGGQKSFPVSYSIQKESSGGSQQVLQPISNGIRRTNLSSVHNFTLLLFEKYISSFTNFYSFLERNGASQPLHSMELG